MSDTKISALTAATSADDADSMPIVQGGTTKKLTFAVLRSLGISAAGGFSTSPRCWHTGGIPATQTTDGNDTTPSTSETYFAEVFVPANATITGARLFNGTAVAGKVVAILYNSSGAVVANSSTSGTDQAGTDAYQSFAFDTTYAAKGPATYYVGFQFNNTGARFNTHILGGFVASKKTGETFGTPTTITPGTSFTTAQGPIASLY